MGADYENRIRELRESRGITQEQLGELVGTSRQAINAIETEKFEPSIWLAYDISSIFGCTIEEVFLFEESVKNPERTAAGGIVMAVRKLRFGNDEILRKRCREVKYVDDRIRLLLDDMMDTLHKFQNGAALAANQVGILKRLVVIDFRGTTLKLVNPVIVGASGVQECIEGCLSFPEQFVKNCPSGERHCPGIG